MVIGLFCGKWPNKDKTSYGSSPPCTASLPSYCDVRNVTVAAVAKWAKSPVNTADRIRSDSICSVDWAFSSVGNSCNCHNKGPQEGDHRLSTGVTSLDGAAKFASCQRCRNRGELSFSFGPRACPDAWNFILRLGGKAILCPNPKLDTPRFIPKLCLRYG